MISRSINRGSSDELPRFFLIIGLCDNLHNNENYGKVQSIKLE